VIDVDNDKQIVRTFGKINSLGYNTQSRRRVGSPLDNQ